LITENKAEELSMKCTFNKCRRGRRRNSRGHGDNPILDQYDDVENVYISFCDFDNVIIDPEIKAGNYEIIMEMRPDAVQGFPANIEIVNYQADLELFNPNYTKFMVYWRYFLFVLSVIMYCYFNRRMKMVGPRQVLIEQRLVKSLGFTLILWNDPLAYINIIHPNVTT
jgi:hypothetical protein